MDVKLPKGTYVLAVSGGVDSMVLLDILRRQTGIKLVVAHFNHGIRDDSDKDEALVADVARKHRLDFEVGYGQLGRKTSEDDARQARYKFLHSVKKKYEANAIITAHHQDDYLETAMINLLRGTDRKGLIAISSNQRVMRPLLQHPKSAIKSYAKKHKVKWREDSSNQKQFYLRNYIRLHLIPKLDEASKANLLNNIDNVAKISQELDELIATLSQSMIKNNLLYRDKFSLLPHRIGRELLAGWLRNNGIRAFDRHIIERLAVAVKTAPAGTRHDIYSGKTLSISRLTAKINK